MKCEEVREHLVDYLDGQCGQDARGMALHIDACRACREEYRRMQETMRLVREVEVEDPGTEFWRSQRYEIIRAVRKGALKRGTVMDSIFRRIKAGIGPIPSFSFARWYYPLGSLAAVILVCIGIILIGRDDTGANRNSLTASLAGLDQDVLEQVYLNGETLSEAPAFEDLSGISDWELSNVLLAVTDEFKDMIMGGYGESISSEWMAPDVEEEVQGLKPEEMQRLMDMLESISIRG
jgi:hypothetical protein